MRWGTVGVRFGCYAWGLRATPGFSRPHSQGAEMFVNGATRLVLVDPLDVIRSIAPEGNIELALVCCMEGAEKPIQRTVFSASRITNYHGHKRSRNCVLRSAPTRMNILFRQGTSQHTIPVCLGCCCVSQRGYR